MCNRPPTEQEDQLFYGDLWRATNERVAIWARYNSMVIAVSILFTGSVYATNFSFVWLPDVAGIFVCVLWFSMHLSGYRLFAKSNKPAINLPKWNEPIFLASSLVPIGFAVLFGTILIGKLYFS